ncbi:hypothetical protein R0J91_18455, partial [Micrococcus sp. SIMBA_131]
DQIEAYARGAAGDSAEVLARIHAVTTARERIAANVPEQLALEALMLALLPRRVRTPRRRCAAARGGPAPAQRVRTTRSGTSARPG